MPSGKEAINIEIMDNNFLKSAQFVCCLLALRPEWSGQYQHYLFKRASICSKS